MAQPSRPAGLAGGRLCRIRLGYQTLAQANGDVIDVSAVRHPDTGQAARRSGKPTSFPRRTLPTAGRICSRQRLGRQRVTGFHGWRPGSQAIPAGWIVERGQPGRRPAICSGPRRKSVSTFDVHLLETIRPCSDDDHLRRTVSRKMFTATLSHKHPTAGAGHNERPAVCRSGTSSGGSRTHIGRSIPRTTNRIRVPSYGWRQANQRRAKYFGRSIPRGTRPLQSRHRRSHKVPVHR